jgi:cytochrome d ubiquinol oxidase subunit II
MEDTLILLDYETLRLLWWGLLGALLIGFAVMDGFDLGVATLLPFVSRTEVERRVMLETIEPVWEGNQVWLVLGAGASFAAWPALYATVFSGFYVAMLLALLALILRPVGFAFRNKVPDPRWRSVCDWTLFAGGFVPAFIFGVAFGNLLQGVPFHLDESLRSFYGGGFFGLLNPFALLCGLVSVTMLTMHGAVYLGLKTEGAVAARAQEVALWASRALVLLFAVAGLWTAFALEGYVVTESAGHAAPSNPLAKTVVRETGAWLHNYGAYRWLMAAPVLGFAGAIVAPWLLRAGRAGLAFVASSAGVFGVVATAGVSMFPFLLPSSTSPGSSLTVWDASSSRATLFIMLLATAVFLPLIIAYTSWVFRVLRGKVTAEHVEEHEGAPY